MLNQTIYVVDLPQKAYSYNQTNFYKQICDLEGNRTNILNSLIFPNFDLLKQDKTYHELYANDYRKLYYNDQLLDLKSEYNAFYPENFYYFWEILHTFKIITDQSKIFVFYDAENTKVPLGHLESVFRFCEDNFKYEDNEYYHLVSEKVNHVRNKKFTTINKNYKTYILKDDKVIKNFDCFISQSKDINISFLMAGKAGSNAILYLDDFFDCKYDKMIEKLAMCYEKVYIYQSSIQDPLITSAYLIMLNFKGNNDLTKDTSLSQIRNNYYISYLEKISNLQNRLTFEENIIKQSSDILDSWMCNYNLIITPSNYTNEISYFGYNLKVQPDTNMINMTNFYHKKLHANKRNLNKYKRIIDTKEQFIDNNLDKDIIDWNKLTDCIDLYKNLKKMITWKFNAEAVNNIWLKFYELLVQENIIEANIKKIKTFHMYETTGSSIFAFNHYLATHTNADIFEWYARCPNYQEFKGRYNLLDIYPNNWIDYHKAELMKNDNRLKDVDIIICDIGLRIPPDKFNEQESFMALLILEQLYISLDILPLNKTLIIKLFLPLAESITINILYLLAIIFKNVKIVKPMSSHASSSEIYCICRDYNVQLTPEIVKNIKIILDKKDINLNIFTTIPNSFINEIVHISDTLTQKQIESIKRSLYLRNYYYYDYELQNNISDVKEEKCEHWININKLKIINDQYKLISLS